MTSCPPTAASPAPLTVVLALTLLSVAACSSLSPGAEKVRVTRDPKDVAGCKAVGQVSGLTGTQALPGAEKKMMNAALALGADVVFVTSTIGSYDGVAYRCEK
jgi:hypothetical protein